MEQKQSLFEIVFQSQVLTQQIIEAGGELSPELEQALEQVDLAITAKVDGYNAVMDRLELEATYWKAKADMYSKIAKAHTAAQDRMKNAIKQAMQAMGKTEVCGDDVKFKLANAQPKLILDEAKIPKEFKMIVTTHVVDKERIKTALKEGFAVAGAQLEPSVALRAYVNKKEQ